MRRTKGNSPVGKKLVCLSSSFLLAAGSFAPAAALPLQAQEKSGIELLKEKLSQKRTLAELNQNFHAPDQTASIGVSQGSVQTAAALPEKVDLRAIDKDGDGVVENYVSRVKRQTPWGTCWTFGVMAALETTLAYQYDTPVEPDNELDLSERHLAYFTNRPIAQNDPSHQGGEGAHYYKESTLNKEWQGGANPDYATSLFSSGIGPVMESDAPYRGKEGLITNQYGQTIRDGKVYDWDGNPVEEGDLEPYCYSPYDDWSVDEELHFVNYFTLQNSSILPLPYTLTPNADGSSTYHFNEEGLRAMKQELANGKAVAVGFCGDQSMPEDGLENAKYLHTANWAHYTYDVVAPNHMVCAVGYDDNYPKENFLPGHQPPKDGAFICKNSWGAKDADFPNQDEWGIDGSGYFYLSYYDQSLQCIESFDFDYRDDLSEKNYTIGQYDFMPAGEMPDVSTETPQIMANVFKAPDDILINALSTQSATANTTVTLDLYRLNKDYENPLDGELVCSSTKSFPYAGYHRIELDKSYAFAKGSPLSIVVTTKRADGTYEINYDMTDSKLACDQYNLLNPDASVVKWMEGVINPGESYHGALQEDGQWEWDDWAEMIDRVTESSLTSMEEIGLLDAIENEDAETLEKLQNIPVDTFAFFTIDNFPIKYYADFVADEISFKDLGFDSGNPHWAVLSGDIPAVLSKGLMTGKSESVFAPDDVLKRAEAAMTLFRLSGESDPEKISAYSGPSSFKDVNVSAWYGPAMNWAAQNGIFVGSNGCVRPDDSISRQELAAILYRYGIKTGAVNNTNTSRNQTKALSYLDAPDAKDVSDWARDSMAWAYENGLITGYQPSGSLLPKSETKRGEYAKILLAALDILEV